MYVACGLLHNARVCCYGSILSEYFDVSPPEIDDYFHWGWKNIKPEQNDNFPLENWTGY